jgi:hypothetical protein
LSYSRFLAYETNNNAQYPDYGVVTYIINDKLINVNMGGEKDSNGNPVILPSVMVQGNYVPKLGDWVTISWENGQPVAYGGNNNSNSAGLVNINNDVKIVSQTDMANGVINSDHIRANTIQAYHISAGSITTQAISANAVTADKIAAGAITALQISAGSITADRLAAGSITSQQISAGAITGDRIAANTITGDKIAAQQISANHILAGTIDASLLNVSARTSGLLGSYYQGTSANGAFMGNRVEGPINFNWGTGAPSIVGTGNNWFVRWQGLLYSPQAGNYTFYVTADDGAKLWVDNQLVVDAWTGNIGGTVSGAYTLSSGNWYTIRLDYYQTTGNASIVLEWKKPSDGTKSLIPAQNLTQAQTIIDGGTILSNSITAASMKVGTITAASGVIADAAITTAMIANGAITSAKIGNAEVKTANIASGNITTALIADAAITNAKIQSLDASKITSGYISASLISAGSITGDKIAAATISGNNIAAGAIDTNQLRAGAVTTGKIAAGAITGDRIAAGTISGDKIEAGTITTYHISTVGLDAQLINVYDSKTGETLIGGGYLRTGGLDVGVVQSDNLCANGMFLVSSSKYGFKRDNPQGEALLGSNTYIPGGSQVWKINASTGAVVNKLDIPARKPVGIDIDENGTYAYVTVQGDNTLVQVDLANFVLTSNKLNLDMGPQVIKWTGDALGDMKHFFVLNTDPMDMNIPDSLMVIDAPPMSVNGDLYLHHQIPLGNEPYDFVIDTNKYVYITQASQGDIAIIDASPSTSMYWHVIGTIPISAYATDNYHGGLPAQYGLGVAVGGDTSAQYNSSSNMGSMSMGMDMGGMDHHGSYAASNGSLKSYAPHGIALSADSDTLYVCDYANGELVVVSKSGSAPYNSLTGRHDVSGGAMGMGGGGSPAMSVQMGEMPGGGPTTRWVWYRIPVGDEPEFIQVVNGKIFITLEGEGKMAIINESEIINAINADRAYYATWNNNMPMNPYPNISVRKITLGAKPNFMKVASNGKIFVSLSGQNQIAVVDSITETVTSLFSTGANPKGIAISPDGAYLYVVNNGGSGDLSFVYPKGPYIGDAYLGLEGTVEYQGAEFWTPDRSDWVYDGSGNIKSSSAVEFRINEPFLNEGGYVKLVTNGVDFQYAQIEQDIYNVTNYSNGNNIIQAVAEKLLADSGNIVFYPRNEWLSNPAPSNIKICYDNGSGGTVRTPANPSTYTIYYGTGRNSRIVFSGGVVPSGNWVEADYTARNDLYFKSHNGSIEIAIENSSSPNFSTYFEIDELVPKFVSVDNRQTSPFTPISDGINETYTGLEYSVMTNRALNISGNKITTTASGGSIIGSLTSLVNANYSDSVVIGSGNQSVTLDLTNTYMIGMINLYRPNYSTYMYNEKVEVSEDGMMWMTVYDSSMPMGGMGMPMISGNQNMLMFDAQPTRYVRVTSNGYKDDMMVAHSTNPFIEIEAYGDWQVEYGYTYPSNSQYAGQQIATNGVGFVSTDVSGAYVAMDIQIEFTTWWYVTYIVAPGFGTMKVEMPSMGMSHFLFLDSPYVNKVAHRHIMPFTPSVNIKENPSLGVKAGKHRAVIRQESGKITIDRFRFEDFQLYAKNSMLVTSDAPATFTRYKLVAEQAKWYVGSGNQSTFGAYDQQRLNPDTGLPDHSVPIKYRMRVRAELNPSGGSVERGIAYATSAIFETGKQSTHWRRNEGQDSYPGNRIEAWDATQPHKTGIQDYHLANGAVRGEKILNGAIMDWHISPYARIAESKLLLNYPTHNHTNKAFLDALAGFSGNGSSNYVARADHDHNGVYLPISGTAVNANTVGNISANQFMRSDQNTSTTGSLTVGGTLSVNGGSIQISGTSSPYLSIGVGNATSPILKLRSTGIEGWLKWNDATDTFEFRDTNAANLMPIMASNATFTGSLSVTGNIITNSALTAGSISTTGTVTINRASTHLQFQESGTNKWHIESVGGQLKFVETGQATRLVLNTGNAGTITWNGNVVWHSGNFVPSNYATMSYLTGNYLTSANTASSYLAITGGTINNQSSEPYINFQSGGADKGRIRANASGLMVISATGGSIYLRPSGDTNTTSEFMVSNGNVTFGGNVVYHAGNFITGNYVTMSYLSANYLTSANISSTYATTAYLTGNYLSLTGGTINGNINSNGQFTNTTNGPNTRIVGVNHAYIEYYSSGLAAGRKAWIGFGFSGTATFTITNQDTGDLVLNAGISGNVKIGSNVVWHSGNFVPSNYATMAYLTGNYLTSANISSTYVTTDYLTGNYYTGANSDSRYLKLDGSNTLTGSVRIIADNNVIGSDIGALRFGIYKKAGYAPGLAVSSGGTMSLWEMSTTDLSSNITGSSVLNTLLTVSNSTFQYKGNNIYHAGNFITGNYATIAYVSGNYYTMAQTYSAAQIDAKVAAAGDIRAASANVFTNTNTFTNAGQAIKVAPSANVAAGTKVIQVIDSLANDLFVVDASGNVTVKGNLNVSGSTVQQTATTVSGNQTINGNLTVNGTTILGAVSTDNVNVNAGTMTLASGTVLKQIGVFNEVMRFPVFGIAGDLQFQTNNTSYENILDHYMTFDTANSCLPPVPVGATRYYKLLVIYSDDTNNGSTLNIVQRGTSTSIASFTLPAVLGVTDGTARTWISPAFTTSYVGHTTFQVKRNVDGNIAIKHIAIIAYDVY